jgi:hypothetical protein
MSRLSHLMSILNMFIVSNSYKQQEKIINQSAGSTSREGTKGDQDGRVEKNKDMNSTNN